MLAEKVAEPLYIYLCGKWDFTTISGKSLNKVLSFTLSGRIKWNSTNGKAWRAEPSGLLQQSLNPIMTKV